MNGPRDKFLPGTSLAIDQDRRIRGGNEFNASQDSPDSRTATNDFLKPLLASNLVFEIQRFFRKLLLQLSDFCISKTVLNCSCDLVGDLFEEIYLAGRSFFRRLSSKTPNIRLRLRSGIRYPVPSRVSISLFVRNASEAASPLLSP